MRITVILDDALVDQAHRLTGVAELSTLIHAGLKALIERASARRLARLEVSEPHLQQIRRRRTRPA